MFKWRSKVGGPEIGAVHRGKKVGGPRPSRPNSFRRLWLSSPLNLMNAVYMLQWYRRTMTRNSKAGLDTAPTAAYTHVVTRKHLPQQNHKA